MMGVEHWSAELNHNYRDDSGQPMWILRYDPTPGGRRNADGTTSYSLNFPALQLTSWVAEPEVAAANIAAALNAHNDLVAALEAQERAENANANCPDCEGLGNWAECARCSELFGNAIDLRHAVLARVRAK